jgi:hypothetical protein
MTTQETGSHQALVAIVTLVQCSMREQHTWRRGEDLVTVTCKHASAVYTQHLALLSATVL